MNDVPMGGYALLTLDNKSGLEEIASRLVGLGYSILCSRECEGILDKSGIEFTTLEELTGTNQKYGFPVSLDQKIEYLLTHQDEKAHRINFVYASRYGLDHGFDVGGLSLILLALKGGRIACHNKIQALQTITLLEKGIYAKEARAKSARNNWNYVIRETCNAASQDSGIWIEGENPRQRASLIERKELAPGDKYTVSVAEKNHYPCFTNYSDMINLGRTIESLENSFDDAFGKIPYISIGGKHGNAVGVGVSWDSKQTSIRKCLYGDPQSIWGGEMIVNFKIEKEEADGLIKSKERAGKLGSENWMLDVIWAPDISKAAYEVLEKRPARKILKGIAEIRDAKEIYQREGDEELDIIIKSHGIILQTRNEYFLGADDYNIIRDNDLFIDMAISQAVAFNSFNGGNEIAIAKDGALLGCGGGPSTYLAAQNAIYRAERWHKIKGATFCADAFFPFSDAIEVLLDSGVKAGVAPKGGRRFSEVEEACSVRHVKMRWLNEDVRGFARH